ncbi:MAG: Transcriptional repressor NrdR [Patescibacteria group bacterium]|nr:Transcriptional repressor NrdR [Patescibacteria group bacterium]
MSIYRHMQCPICKTRLQTTNSRKTNSGASTWRRRHCPNCKITLTSREVLDLSSLIQINNKNYSRLKLTAKLARISSGSLEEDIANIVDTIESRLLSLTRHNHQITEDIYTQEVLSVLKKIDRPSYLRFLAQLEED